MEARSGVENYRSPHPHLPLCRFTDEGAEAQGGDVPWGQTLALLSSGPCYHHFGHISLTKGWMDALS